MAPLFVSVGLSSQELNTLVCIRGWRKGFVIQKRLCAVSNAIHRFISYLHELDPEITRLNELDDTNLSTFEVQILKILSELNANNEIKVNEILNWWFPPNCVTKARTLIGQIGFSLEDAALVFDSRTWIKARFFNFKTDRTKIDGSRVQFYSEELNLCLKPISLNVH